MITSDNHTCNYQGQPQWALHSYVTSRQVVSNCKTSGVEGTRAEVLLKENMTVIKACLCLQAFWWYSHISNIVLASFAIFCSWYCQPDIIIYWYWQSSCVLCKYSIELLNFENGSINQSFTSYTFVNTWTIINYILSFCSKTQTLMTAIMVMIVAWMTMNTSSSTKQHIYSH